MVRGAPTRWRPVEAVVLTGNLDKGQFSYCANTEQVSREEMRQAQAPWPLLLHTGGVQCSTCGRVGRVLERKLPVQTPQQRDTVVLVIFQFFLFVSAFFSFSFIL